MTTHDTISSVGQDVLAGDADLHAVAVDLSATAADIAADIAAGRNCPDNVTRALRLLDGLAAEIGGQSAYQSLIRCRHASRDEDGDIIGCAPDHDPCDYAWFCNICDREAIGGECPDHAPSAVPGLQLINCDQHPRTWLLADDGYGPPCPWCLSDDAAKAHDGCAHARHWRWRRWRITHKVLSNLYGAGVLRGWGWGYDSHCRGCATGVMWGRNSYLLGWPRWKWQCLLVARHWPGEEVLAGICGKCNPCPSCGSQRFGHEFDCQWGAS